jgi:hypothetical protein
MPLDKRRLERSTAFQQIVLQKGFQGFSGLRIPSSAKGFQAPNEWGGGGADRQEKALSRPVEAVPCSTFSSYRKLGGIGAP